MNNLYIAHCSAHSVVGVSTISRPEHRIGQTREVACTKKSYLKSLQEVVTLSQLHTLATCRYCASSSYLYHTMIIIGRNITKAAHDYQFTIKKYRWRTQDGQFLRNWHGIVRKYKNNNL